MQRDLEALIGSDVGPANCQPHGHGAGLEPEVGRGPNPLDEVDRLDLVRLRTRRGRAVRHERRTGCRGVSPRRRPAPGDRPHPARSGRRAARARPARPARPWRAGRSERSARTPRGSRVTRRAVSRGRSVDRREDCRPRRARRRARSRAPDAPDRALNRSVPCFPGSPQAAAAMTPRSGSGRRNASRRRRPRVPPPPVPLVRPGPNPRTAGQIHQPWRACQARPGRARAIVEGGER